jgi:hydrogenase expression/formation protein HypD
MRVLFDVFKPVDSEWRGLGTIKKSGLGFKRRYQSFDAEKHFKIKVKSRKAGQGCICGNVLQGIKTPKDCKLFKETCTPQHPIGPCMVSSEGTCAAYYKYGS